MYTNEFGQTIKADLAIVYTTAEELTQLSNVVLNRMTQSSTPYIVFNVMESTIMTLEAEVHDLKGDALENYKKVIPPTQGVVDDAEIIASTFIKFIFGESSKVHGFDNEGRISIEIPFSDYISSTHGL